MIGDIPHYSTKEVSLTESSIEFESIDVTKTDVVAGVGSTGIYIYLTELTLMLHQDIEGYRLGARTNDTLKVLIFTVSQEYAARIVMPDNTDNPTSSAEKVFDVKRSSRYQ